MSAMLRVFHKWRQTNLKTIKKAQKHQAELTWNFPVLKTPFGSRKQSSQAPK